MPKWNPGRLSKCLPRALYRAVIKLYVNTLKADYEYSVRRPGNMACDLDISCSSHPPQPMEVIKGKC